MMSRQPQWAALLVMCSMVGGWAEGQTQGLPDETREPKLQRFEKTEIHMGSPFTLVFYSNNEKLANHAFERSFARIAELDKILSDYDPESETNRLCESAPHAKPVAVSADLTAVLLAAAEISNKTDQAFDVTVGPLTKLWRRARRQKVVPSLADRTKALAALGMEGVVIDRAAAQVQLKKPNMRLDFGGIGQGYAADEVLKICKEFGITQALVNASGDVAALDPPPGAAGWKVAIGSLQPKSESPKEFVLLANGALTTSGDAFQFVEIDGKRYSHIVDPKTGMGSERRISATVIAPRGVLADALATALCLIAPEEALSLLEKDFPGAVALVVEADSTGATKELVSRDFPTRHAIGGETPLK